MIRLHETIIVEGKDDAAAVRKAAAANIITTSGYGLSEETIAMIRTAYERTGIVIFTDPDHAGRSIRERLARLFPNAKHAYLTARESRRKGDVGIENATPDAIERALRTAVGCGSGGAETGACGTGHEGTEGANAKDAERLFPAENEPNGKTPREGKNNRSTGRLDGFTAISDPDRRSDGGAPAPNRLGRPVNDADLNRLGLSGGPGAAEKREKAGALLGVGYGNAKTFLRRLNYLGISLEELEYALRRSETVS